MNMSVFHFRDTQMQKNKTPASEPCQPVGVYYSDIGKFFGKF